MDRRYQVFISSTKRDLERVRQEIALALLDDKYIPVGMEQWGATPLDSWSLIKRFIGQCDYYVLIIAGLYGSIFRETGLSFTESEYDYAVESKLPVLAFLHKNLEDLPGKKIEQSSRRKKMLERFREKVKRSWNVEEWEDEKELPRLIASRLHKAVDICQRPGWVRGDCVPENLQKEFEAILYPSRALGIAKIVPDGKADSRTMSSSLEASTEIRIIVISGTRFLDGYRRSIVKAISSGAEVRLLIPKPESEFVKDVGLSERDGEDGERRAEEIAQEIREAEPRFVEYLREARRGQPRSILNLGTISIGYYTTLFRSTMILCDKKWGWLTIMVPPLRASESLSFELIRTGDECFLHDCIRHFDRTWEIVDSRNDVIRL
ncbi:MAG: DUF4062 domain-containing protein [Thermodesulfobacteriota bacterium]